MEICGIEEAIEYLKLKIKNDNLTIQGMFGDIYEEIQKDNTAIEILLTAYEKEKEKNKDAIDNNYISKDKIKAKIEECENKIKKIRSKKVINEPEDTIIITRYAHYISVLQSLLEKE